MYLKSNMEKNHHRRVTIFSPQIHVLTYLHRAHN